MSALELKSMMHFGRPVSFDVQKPCGSQKGFMAIASHPAREMVLEFVEWTVDMRRDDVEPRL